MAVMCLVLAFAFAVALKKPLRRAPWVFYLLAAGVDLLVVFGSRWGLPGWLSHTVVLANARCLFAFGLFAVVMFLGVLKDGSRLKRWLVPVRAELSIVAAILVVGHVVRYLGVYSMRVLTSPASVANGMLVSFAVAVVLCVLLAVLTVTSFKAVKRSMGAKGWKSVQRLAYPFFVLVYAHVLLIMGRSAMAGGQNALTCVVVCGAVTLAYVVLRVARWWADRCPQERAVRECPVEELTA